MAKAKKSENSAASSTPKKKPAAKKVESKPSITGAAPMIDTNLAAAAAAKMLGAGFKKSSGNANQPPAESAMFKQLKAGLNKPAAFGGNHPLNKSLPIDTNKSHNSFKQVGHNQTFGADVNRAGVPRRTGGG